MSTTTRNTSETSAMISLAELAKIEEQRVRDEDARRATAREREARDRREAEARKRAAEAAEIAAEADARAKRVRAEAEEKARIEARERAAADVARIEAEGRARLEAGNAARAHELAMLRVQTESGKKRLSFALATVIALVVCGGGAAGYSVSQKLTTLTDEAEHLRVGQRALAEERQQAKSTQLAALDRRHAALVARKIKGAEDAMASAEAARNAIDRKTLDLDRLRAFGDAIDALQAKLDTLDKLALLDRRLADLGAWASERKHGELMGDAKRAAARAWAMCNEEGALAYEIALREARDALAHASSTGGGRVAAGRQEPVGGGACLAGDPGCGPDGKRIF